MTEQPSPEYSTIVVPTDLTAEELVAEVEDVFRLAEIHFHFNDAALPLIRQGLEFVRGKSLSVVTHLLDRYYTTAEMLELQCTENCWGNAAAFLSWVAQTKRKGMSACIISASEALCCIYQSSCDVAPRDTSRDWMDGYLAVFFREN